MKQLLFSFLLAICVLGTSCEGKYESPHSDNIIGKWKLIEVVTYRMYYQPYEHQSNTVDCSNDNIIYDFQVDNRLVITGLVPDSLQLFDAFKEGVHFYEYRKPEAPPSDPGPNLTIDKPEFGKRDRYFCWAPLSKDTMTIATGQPDGNELGCTCKLIKLND